MFFQLRDVAANGAPTTDLTQVIFAAAPAIISAIPLEPPARVVGMNPAFASPFRQRLRCVHAKIIQRGARPIRREPRAFEPARRKFFPTIGHVFPAKDAECEHLLRRQLGRETRAKSATHRFCAGIDVAILHFVVHLHAHRFHLITSLRLRSMRSNGQAFQSGTKENEIPAFLRDLF